MPIPVPIISAGVSGLGYVIGGLFGKKKKSPPPSPVPLTNFFPMPTNPSVPAQPAVLDNVRNEGISPMMLLLAAGLFFLISRKR